MSLAKEVELLLLSSILNKRVKKLKSKLAKWILLILDLQRHFVSPRERINMIKNTPVTYIPNCVAVPDLVCNTLMDELSWVERTEVRKEYYWNLHNVPYTYGSGVGQRTYDPQPDHPVLEYLRNIAFKHTGIDYDVCFLNRYDTPKDHLGWHADNSPEMDDAKPIVIISLGARREIYFRPNVIECHVCEAKAGEPHDVICSVGRDLFTPNKADYVEKLWLDSGSVCIMLPGMQDTHEHRIPKASYECGPRISLTFRGYVKT